MPRKKAKSKMYFTQDTEDAIISYNKTDDRMLKNDLYVAEIGKAFDKLEKIVSNTKYSVGNIKMDIETTDRTIFCHLVGTIYTLK